jgi:SMI1 / KNR4 family (SUKH-1)
MKIFASIAMFALALAGCSKNKNPTSKSPMFDESVYQELKSGLGVELPEDYVKFMRSYSGDTPEPNSFWVVRDDWGSGIDSLYVMAQSEDQQSMLIALDWDGLPLKPGLIPIGGDGCFGYILMSVRPEDHGTIHFCCTWSEDGKTDMYESQGFWKIADNFTDFIKNLGEMPEEK